jgi:uncharacterized membrane protein
MLEAMHRKWKEWEHWAVKIAGLSLLSMSLLLMLRLSKHIAHRFCMRIQCKMFSQWMSSEYM